VSWPCTYYSEIVPLYSSITSSFTPSPEPDSCSLLPPAALDLQATGLLPPPPPPTCPYPRPTHRMSFPSPPLALRSSVLSPSPPPLPVAAGDLWETPQCRPSQQDGKTQSGEHPRLWMGSWAPPSSATRLCSRHRQKLCMLQVSHALLQCKCCLLYTLPSLSRVHPTIKRKGHQQ